MERSRNLNCSFLSHLIACTAFFNQGIKACLLSKVPRPVCPIFALGLTLAQQYAIVTNGWIDSQSRFV